MFIVEINSNQLMNAGQIPMNRCDHVGVALDRGTLGPKLEVEVTSQLTQTQSQSREYAGENIPKHSLIH